MRTHAHTCIHTHTLTTIAAAAATTKQNKCHKFCIITITCISIKNIYIKTKNERFLLLFFKVFFCWNSSTATMFTNTDRKVITKTIMQNFLFNNNFMVQNMIFSLSTRNLERFKKVLNVKLWQKQKKNSSNWKEVATSKTRGKRYNMLTTHHSH